MQTDLNTSIDKNIAVAYQTLSQLPLAQQLAQQLAIPLITQDHTHAYEFVLVFTGQRLELHQSHTGAPGAVYVDFLAGKNAFRAQHVKQEMLHRAVHIKNQPHLNIIDATAGLGRDGFILAMLGHRVTLLERNPVISALLADGIARLKAAMPTINMQLIQIDAQHYLAQLPPAHYPDIIYLDPMFPERTKSALVKKDMRLLQQLIGHAEDADTAKLLTISLTMAKQRTIVKRPRLADFLGQQKPTYSLTGKVNRFDIYQHGMRESPT